jgi:hypothetical protein
MHPLCAWVRCEKGSGLYVAGVGGARRVCVETRVPCRPRWGFFKCSFARTATKRGYEGKERNSGSWGARKATTSETESLRSQGRRRRDVGPQREAGPVWRHRWPVVAAALRRRTRAKGVGMREGRGVSHRVIGLSCCTLKAFGAPTMIGWRKWGGARKSKRRAVRDLVCWATRSIGSIRVPAPTVLAIAGEAGDDNAPCLVREINRETKKNQKRGRALCAGVDESATQRRCEHSRVQASRSLL